MTHGPKFGVAGNESTEGDDKGNQLGSASEYRDHLEGLDELTMTTFVLGIGTYSGIVI